MTEAIEEPFVEWHLADFDIRHAIADYLLRSGYDVKPGTLHLYGYGAKSNCDLTEFQGHVEARPAAIAPITAQSLAESAFYFGCQGEAGHSLWNIHGLRLSFSRCTRGLPSDFPVAPSTFDGAFCPLLLDESEGKARLWHTQGWTILAFWDCSVDKRGGSNSNFILRGTLTFEAACAMAQKAFPQVWKRFSFPIELS